MVAVSGGSDGPIRPKDIQYQSVSWPESQRIDLVQKAATSQAKADNQALEEARKAWQEQDIPPSPEDQSGPLEPTQPGEPSQAAGTESGVFSSAAEYVDQQDAQAAAPGRLPTLDASQVRPPNAYGELKAISERGQQSPPPDTGRASVPATDDSRTHQAAGGEAQPKQQAGTETQALKKAEDGRPDDTIANDAQDKPSRFQALRAQFGGSAREDAARQQAADSQSTDQQQQSQTGSAFRKSQSEDAGQGDSNVEMTDVKAETLAKFQDIRQQFQAHSQSVTRGAGQSPGRGGGHSP